MITFHRLTLLLLGLACASYSQSASAALVSFWNFNEASSGTANAIDQADSNTGTFVTPTVRTIGLIGAGAALFNNSAGGVAVGAGTGNNYSTTTGITVEALIRPTWDGTAYDEIFRKEDGGNRILFSFQNDPNNGGAQPAVAAGPVLSFGLNIGGAYNELDMPLDGAAGRPTLAQLTDGATHHVVATYDAASNTKALWVDGTMRFSTTLSSGNITSGGGAIATIGNVAPGSGEPFTGVIDEVAFWNNALTSTQIATHYSNVQAGRDYFGVPEPGSLVLAGLGLLGLVGCKLRRLRA